MIGKRNKTEATQAFSYVGGHGWDILGHPSILEIAFYFISLNTSPILFSRLDPSRSIFDSSCRPTRPSHWTTPSHSIRRSK